MAIDHAKKLVVKSVDSLGKEHEDLLSLHELKAWMLEGVPALIPDETDPIYSAANKQLSNVVLSSLFGVGEYTDEATASLIITRVPGPKHISVPGEFTVDFVNPAGYNDELSVVVVEQTKTIYVYLVNKEDYPETIVSTALEVMAILNSEASEYILVTEGTGVGVDNNVAMIEKAVTVTKCLVSTAVVPGNFFIDVDNSVIYVSMKEMPAGAIKTIGEAWKIVPLQSTE